MLGTSACTDLDTPLRTAYETFPDNPIALEGDYNQCYFYIRNEGWLGRNFWETVWMQGDEAMGVNFLGNYYDNGRYFLCSIHDMRPDHQSGGQEGDLLAGITYTNKVIKQYCDGDPEHPRVAPLRAIRAFYTFLFMDMYGDTPIMDRVLDPASGEAFDRAPRAEAAKWIEKELLGCMDDLNDANDSFTYGKPNKWMAKALLAKLYLNWPVYMSDIYTYDGKNATNEKLNDCVAICNDIIDSKIFELGKGYRKKFFPDNGQHIKDFIYACPMDPYIYGNGYWGGWQPNRFFDFRSIGFLTRGTWNWYPKETPAGVYVLIPECVDRFCLAGDERNDMLGVGEFHGFDDNFNVQAKTIYCKDGSRYVKLIYKKDITWYNGNIGMMTGDVGPEGDVTCLMEGARLFKYPPLEEDYDGRWDKKGLQGNDIPIFRYADILLTKAECIAKGAIDPKGATAASLINEVRDCASAPHFTGTATVKDVMDERGRELIMEMWRRNDLIRNGMFEDDWGWKNKINPDGKNPQRRLMPLSNGTLGTNTNWNQNAGYSK